MRARSVFALVAVVAVLGLLAFGLLSKGSSGGAVGSPVPTRSLPRLGGHGDGSLTAYRGRWALVNFWASWCIPCRQEAPALEDFSKAHSKDDFTVVGIDTRDLSDDGEAFVHKYGLGYPQLRDGDGQLAHDFGTTGVPENFLVDPTGRVRLALRGPVTAEYLNDSVAPLLPRSEGSS